MDCAVKEDGYALALSDASLLVASRFMVVCECWRNLKLQCRPFPETGLVGGACWVLNANALSRRQGLLLEPVGMR